MSGQPNNMKSLLQILRDSLVQKNILLQAIEQKSKEQEAIVKKENFTFKEIDENLMEDYLNYDNREKWNPIISESYDIKLDSDDKSINRTRECLLNNAYILSTNDIRRLIEHYEREKKKLEERIERLDETMRNQQSLASYQEMECELNALGEDLSEIDTKLWALKNFKGMLEVIENCYEEENFREPCDILNAYLIIMRM